MRRGTQRGTHSQSKRSICSIRRIYVIRYGECRCSPISRIDSNNINATDSAGGVLHDALNPNSSGRAMLAKVKMAANAAGLVQSIFRSLDEGRRSGGKLS